MAINRVERLIINLDTAMPLMCGWAECDRRARTPYQVRTHQHPPNWNCGIGQHVTYAFCSESHRDYWVSSTGTRALELADRNRGMVWGMHSAGNRGMIR